MYVVSTGQLPDAQSNAIEYTLAPNTKLLRQRCSSGGIDLYSGLNTPPPFPHLCVFIYTCSSIRNWRSHGARSVYNVLITLHNKICGYDMVEFRYTEQESSYFWQVADKSCFS